MRTSFLYSKPLVYGTVSISLIIYFVISFNSFSQSVKKVKSNQELFQFKEGDIVFQSGNSRQCIAVKLATHSTFSHCGIYFIGPDHKGYIYEAVQPVRKTPVKQWIQNGIEETYSVVRLKNATKVLNDSTLTLMKHEANKYINRDYDIYFGWGDDKIYCSEYVWKIYKNALNVEIGSLKSLKDFDLSSSEVQSIMHERYGNNIPYQEKVVAPSDLFEATNVEKVR